MSKQLAAFGLLAAGIAVGWGVRAEPPRAQRAEPFARYVEHGYKELDLNDLAPILHIERYVGQVQLNSAYRNASLVMAAYRNGKPVELPGAEAEVLPGAETNSAIRYAVQVVDLDYLRLGDAKKDHCRMRFALRIPEVGRVAVERDIPKDVIDLSKCSNLGFTERAATETEVPLFWLKQGGTVPGPTVASKGEVVDKWTKDGRVLIVSLRFNDRKGKGGK
jgi:hypothetical protein